MEELDRCKSEVWRLWKGSVSGLMEVNPFGNSQGNNGALCVCVIMAMPTTMVLIGPYARHGVGFGKKKNPVRGPCVFLETQPQSCIRPKKEWGPIGRLGGGGEAERIGRSKKSRIEGKGALIM